MALALTNELDIKLQETHPDLTLEIFDELIGMVTLMANDSVQKLPMANQYKKFFEHPGVIALVKQNAPDFVYEDGCIILTGKTETSSDAEIDIGEFDELEDEEEG